MLRIITHSNTLSRWAVTTVPLSPLCLNLFLGLEPVQLVLIGFTITAFLQSIVSIGFEYRD